MFCVVSVKYEAGRIKDADSFFSLEPPLSPNISVLAHCRATHNTKKWLEHFKD